MSGICNSLGGPGRPGVGLPSTAVFQRSRQRILFESGSEQQQDRMGSGLRSLKDVRESAQVSLPLCRPCMGWSSTLESCAFMLGNSSDWGAWHRGGGCRREPSLWDQNLPEHVVLVEAEERKEKHGNSLWDQDHWTKVLQAFLSRLTCHCFYASFMFSQHFYAFSPFFLFPGKIHSPLPKDSPSVWESILLRSFWDLYVLCLFILLASLKYTCDSSALNSNK